MSTDNKHPSAETPSRKLLRRQEAIEHPCAIKSLRQNPPFKQHFYSCVIAPLTGAFQWGWVEDCCHTFPVSFKAISQPAAESITATPSYLLGRCFSNFKQNSMFNSPVKSCRITRFYTILNFYQGATEGRLQSWKVKPKLARTAVRLVPKGR